MPATKTAETPEEMIKEVAEEKKDDPLDFDDPEASLTAIVEDSDDSDAVDDDEDSDKDEPVFAEALIERAEASGLTREEALESETPAKLTHLLDAYDRQVAALNKKAGDTADEFEIKLDEDIFSPEIADAFKGMSKHFAGKISGLKAEVKKLVGHIETQKQGDRLRRFDGYINDLGEDFETLLGKGPSNDLDANTKIARTRKAIASEMTTMRLGHESQNRKPPADPELFKRALRVVLGDELDSMSQGKVRKKVKKRQSQMVSKPSHSKAESVMSPTQTAINNVAEKLKSFGIEDYGTTEEDVF